MVRIRQESYPPKKPRHERDRPRFVNERNSEDKSGQNPFGQRTLQKVVAHFVQGDGQGEGDPGEQSAGQVVLFEGLLRVFCTPEGNRFRSQSEERRLAAFGGTQPPKNLTKALDVKKIWIHSTCAPPIRTNRNRAQQRAPAIVSGNRSGGALLRTWAVVLDGSRTE